MGLSFCHVDRVDLLQRMMGFLSSEFSFLHTAFGPEGAILSHKGFIPGFSGAFPEAVAGWTTMVVTATVYKFGRS
jgi:hypothetical protein